MSRVLLLLPTATYRAPDFLEAARRQGIDVVVASEEPSTMETLSPDSLMTLDFSDPEACADRVALFHGRFPLDALVAVDEPTAVVAAAVGQRLGLPHNPPEAARRTRSKLEMRRALSAAGVPGPRFWRLSQRTISEARLDGEWLDCFPLVVKPLAMSGSRGVIRVSDRRELSEAVIRVAAIVAGTEGKFDRDLLIETFMPGAEFAVEAIVDASRGAERSPQTMIPLAIFDKPDPLDGPFFEETIYVTPSRAPEELQRRLLHTTQLAANAIGLRHGPIHAELRADGDDVSVVEIAGRSIGGLCSRSLKFGIGVSLEELILRHALGEPVDTEREKAASGVMMIPVPSSGTLDGVDGQQEAAAVDGIVDLTITLAIGSRLVPLPEASTYLGFLFARGERADHVEASLRRAREKLVIRVTP